MKAIRLADVLQLPIDERLELVGSIWDSIAQVPDAVELSEAQRVELERRLEAYRRNPRAGSPWAEVKARILAGR